MKPRIAGENGEGSPTVGNFSNRKFVRPESASASISFSEINSMHFVAAIAQHFGHGDAGEKMPAGASACDHCIHISLMISSWILSY